MLVLPLLALAGCSSDDGGTAANGGSGGTGGSGGSAGAGGSSASGGAGGASCAPPKAQCGAGCVDPSQDSANCGSCGYACKNGATCSKGSCSTSPSLSVGSISPSLGPMSGGTWLTIKGEGFAKGAKVKLGDARAPAGFVDAQTLIAQAPPGLAGKVDVSVDLGAAGSSVRGQAYTYAAFGLEGTWQKIDMTSARGNWPGIAVLQDGSVLITGGVSNSSGSSVQDTADLYDPATNKSVATAGKMSAPRWTQASVTLLSGKTLVLGTWFGGVSAVNGPLADLFDAKTKTFTPTANKPTLEHRWPHAVLLADGRALIVGYTSGVVELYDPSSDAFSDVAGAPDCTGYRPTRLLDGRVLLVKGGNAPVHLFDPEAGSFGDGGTGPSAIDGDLFTLPDGRVLYVAGSIPTSTQLLPTDVLELWDPAQPGFKAASYHLSQKRQRTLTTAMAGDGSVLVLGGEVGDQVLNPACSSNTFVLTDGVERIDPVAGVVSAFDKLPEKNFVMSAATTLDGSIVAAGGAPCGGGMAYPYFYFLKGKPAVK